MIYINFERCKGCALCTSVCPKKLISINRQKRNAKGFHPAECRDNSQCTACTACALFCPECAIEIER